jgi:hypothetical protein
MNIMDTSLQSVDDICISGFFYRGRSAESFHRIEHCGIASALYQHDLLLLSGCGAFCARIVMGEGQSRYETSFVMINNQTDAHGRKKLHKILNILRIP